jgi:hypothetical protein
MPLNFSSIAQLSGLIPVEDLIIRYLTNLVRYKIKKNAGSNKLALKCALREFGVQMGRYEALINQVKVVIRRGTP